MTITIKKSGVQQQINQGFIRASSVWKPIRRIWLRQGGVWKQASPPVQNLVQLTSGDGFFTSPSTAQVLNVTYPTPLGVVNAKIPTVPGQKIYYSIGDYGNESRFGNLVAPAYNKEVMYWDNEVDSSDFIEVSVATTTGTGFEGNSDNTTLYNQAIAAGCYYNEYSEYAHGDQYAVVRLHTVPISTILGDTKVVITNFQSSRGGSGVDVLQQPTADNNYRVKLNAYDGGYSQWHQYWNLNVQQKVPFLISW